MINIKIKLAHPDAKVPTKNNFTDAGWDIYAAEDKWIWPFIVNKVRTGIHIQMPSGYASLLWDRSGMAIKHMFHRVAGVIDPSFTGEWMVGLYRIFPWPKKIKKGDRIAQAIIQEIPLHITWEKVEALDKTSRGQSGFGSSGK